MENKLINIFDLYFKCVIEKCRCKRQLQTYKLFNKHLLHICQEEDVFKIYNEMNNAVTEINKKLIKDENQEKTAELLEELKKKLSESYSKSELTKEFFVYAINLKKKRKTAGKMKGEHNQKEKYKLFQKILKTNTWEECGVYANIKKLSEFLGITYNQTYEISNNVSNKYSNFLRIDKF